MLVCLGVPTYASSSSLFPLALRECCESGSAGPWQINHVHHGITRQPSRVLKRHAQRENARGGRCTAGCIDPSPPPTPCHATPRHATSRLASSRRHALGLADLAGLAPVPRRRCLDAGGLTQRIARDAMQRAGPVPCGLGAQPGLQLPKPRLADRAAPRRPSCEAHVHHQRASARQAATISCNNHRAERSIAPPATSYRNALCNMGNARPRPADGAHALTATAVASRRNRDAAQRQCSVRRAASAAPAVAPVPSAPTLPKGGRRHAHTPLMQHAAPPCFAKRPQQVIADRRA